MLPVSTVIISLDVIKSIDRVCVVSEVRTEILIINNCTRLLTSIIPEQEKLVLDAQLYKTHLEYAAFWQGTWLCIQTSPN